MWIFCGRTVIFYNIHSCTACGVISPSSITFKRCSLSCGRTHHASPHPAEIVPGTGISLPGSFLFLQYRSIAIASVVVWKVITIFSSRFSFFSPVSYDSITPCPAPVLLIPQQALLRRGLPRQFPLPYYNGKNWIWPHPVSLFQALHASTAHNALRTA